MAAGIRPLFTEVVTQEIGLTTIVSTKLKHLIQPFNLSRLVVCETLTEDRHYSFKVVRPISPAEPVVNTRSTQFKISLIGQVVEGPHKTLAWATDLSRYLIKIDIEPDLLLAGAIEELIQKFLTIRIITLNNSLPINKKAEPIRGKAYRSLFDITLEFEIRQQGSYYKDTDVEASRKIVETDLKVFPLLTEMIDERSHGVR